jgi:glycerophosphoryl diester phosphodiesterase
MSFSEPIVVIGHRGAAGLLPENTLSSFRQAYDCGVHAVELDVYVVEGELVVIHDDTVDRTTNGRGPVMGISLSELRRLDAGNGCQVPLLAEVVRDLPDGVGLNVEMKGPDTVVPVAAFLAEHPGLDVLVSSFRLTELHEFRQLAPDVRVAPLFNRWRAHAWRTAEELGSWAINLSRRAATGPRLAEARRRGLKIFVYTVNDVEEAVRLVSQGATGIFTDFPDRITPAVLADRTLVPDGSARR